MIQQIDIDQDRIAAFCRKWRIRELAVFGSVLRADFGPESDVDFLVSFDPEVQWSLWDHFHMQQELGQLLGRKVDLVTRPAIERSPNWIRRKAILDSAEIVYAQR